MLGSAGVKFQFTGCRHNEDIPQIGMSRTIEMGMAEAYNGRVIVPVTCTIFIDFLLIDSIDVVRNGIGIWTELDNSKG